MDKTRHAKNRRYTAIENTINIRCNWKHVSLEHQIKRFDTSQDLSRSAVLMREIQAADQVTDWKQVRDLLRNVKQIPDIPLFTNLQAKYDESSGAILERVKQRIQSDLDLKVLQTPYLVQLLQVNYLELLKKEALTIRDHRQIEAEAVDAPEVVKLLVEMILLDKDCETLKEIRSLLVDWKNDR